MWDSVQARNEQAIAARTRKYRGRSNFCHPKQLWCAGTVACRTQRAPQAHAATGTCSHCAGIVRFLFRLPIVPKSRNSALRESPLVTTERIRIGTRQAARCLLRLRHSSCPRNLAFYGAAIEVTAPPICSRTSRACLWCDARDVTDVTGYLFSTYRNIRTQNTHTS